MPDFKTDGSQFAVHLTIPKAQHFNSFPSEKLISHFIFSALIRKAVATAIRLNCQPHFHAQKIEEINSARILPTKFEI